MLVFISYPRELQEFAEILDIELSNRGIKTFLDAENIPPTSYWRVEIEEAIKEADFFVVFYLSKAVEDSNRYLVTELKRIESKCREDDSTELITVLFPPTELKDLKPYFSSRQSILASGDKNASHQWTDIILQEIEKVITNKSAAHKKQSENKSKPSWVILVLLATLIIFLIGSGFVLSSVTEEKEKIQSELENANSILENALNDLNEVKKSFLKQPIGESVCKSLMGNYELGQEYVFNWDVNSRSIATHNTTWHATECIFNEEDGTYTLKGIDKTYFDVETIVDGKYARIATVPLSYESEVHINNLDGRLIDRVFNAVIPPKEVKREDIDIHPNGKNNELTKKLSSDFIYKKTDEVLMARYLIHLANRPNGCSPMRGYKGTRIAIAFVCPHYTRVMVKKTLS